jgi:hypothetical protein
MAADGVMTRDLNKLLKFSESLVKESIITDKELERIGKDITDRIRTRTRLGFGVAGDNKPKQKFRQLEWSTVEYREQLEDDGKLSNLTKPDMANMTRFGSMMDSLTHKVGTGSVTILFSEREETKKAFYNTELGRPFMYLTNLETKAVRKIVQENIDAWLDSIIRVF